MLIVDDDRVTRVLLAGLARSLGFHATCVGTADKALALATRDGYGLILMDCLLPGRDGYAAARALRAAGVRTPVVAVTSTCDEAACHAAGVLTVAHAKAGLHEVRTLQELYKLKHGRYAGGLIALSSASVDPQGFLRDASALYRLSSFRFKADAKSYAVVARAKDPRGTLVAVSGP